MHPLLGYKQGMTRVFDAAGKMVPVTAIKVDECYVSQIRTEEKDGYTALQVATGKKRHANKPEAGHAKNLPATPQHIKEFRISTEGYELSQELTLDGVEAGTLVKIMGTTKGKGFAGVIKRHNFSRGPETHGSDHHSAPGSIGAMYPQHVFRGQKMPGHMGGDRQTIRKVKIVDVLVNEGIILVKGPVPGSRGALVEICPM